PTRRCPRHERSSPRISISTITGARTPHLTDAPRMTGTSVQCRSNSRPDSEWLQRWRCESNSDVPESLGAKTNRLQRVLRGRLESPHAVFVEFRELLTRRATT